MRLTCQTLFCLLVACLMVAGVRAEPLGVGSLAPNWVLPDLQGNQVSLYQQAEAGNTTVMVFWASWCRNCKALMPTLRELQNAKGDKPVAIYLMNVWEDNAPEAFTEEPGFNLPVLLRADNVARRFDIGTTPGVVVVGPDKRIIYKRTPGTQMEDVATSLSALLSDSSRESAPEPAVGAPAVQSTSSNH